MFHTTTAEHRVSLVWLALVVSVTLHVVLLAGLSAVPVPLPSHHVAPEDATDPTIAVQIESVDRLES